VTAFKNKKFLFNFHLPAFFIDFSFTWCYNKLTIFYYQSRIKIMIEEIT